MATTQMQQPYAPRVLAPQVAGGANPPVGGANPPVTTPRRNPANLLPQVSGVARPAVQPAAGGGLTGTAVQPQAAGGGLDGTGVQPTGPVTNPTQSQRLRFAGINPSEQRSGLQTLQDLERVLGTPLTAQQQQQARQYINYTDPTGAAMMSGADYNRLMQYAAQQAGGDYAAWEQPGRQPFPTEGPLNPDPFPQPQYEDAPGYQAPTYEEQRFEAPSWEDVRNDPGYQFRQREGMGALQASAAARGMLGTGTFARDMMNYGQELASQEYQNAYNRGANTYGLNADERRFGYNARTEGAQAEYAPRLVTWNARREDGQRAAELTFDRNWQREVYGRDDNYRRNRAAEDDYRYRDNRDEMRRRFLAELGQA